MQMNSASASETTDPTNFTSELITVTNVALINVAVIDPTDSTDVQAVLVH